VDGGEAAPSRRVACCGIERRASNAGLEHEVKEGSTGMRLAVIPGDGIGPEVIDEALKVLTEVAPDVSTTTYDLGAARWHSTGELLPESVLTELSEHDAILLGAVGDPSVPSGILERGLLLRLRFELDHHVNLRPARLYPGVRSPLLGKPEIDLVVVREGTEGPYAGTGGILRRDTPNEVATEVSVNTAFGVERVVRDAFTRAARRERKHLTLVHKTNVLTYSGSLWSRLVEEVSLEHPDVSVSYQHIDATTIHLVTDPGRFDVIVTDNLFGDILTDLAAAVTGGIGLAASGNLDVSRRNPSMFEPVHGSAPDIAGQGIADPTAAVLSVAMMLDHLGHTEEARRIEAAVAFDLATRDHNATGHTQSIGDRLAALVSRQAAPSA
jgi:3-isopropylmalate dehydrogenase